MSRIFNFAFWMLFLSFGAAANDAHALDFDCSDKDQIKKELMAKNQVPVVRFFFDATLTSQSYFQETFFTMNTQNR